MDPVESAKPEKKTYAPPAFTKPTTAQANLLLLGHSLNGNRGAKELLAALYPPEQAEPAAALPNDLEQPEPAAALSNNLEPPTPHKSKRSRFTRCFRIVGWAIREGYVQLVRR